MRGCDPNVRHGRSEREESMREILYKAKRIDTGKWSEGFYCKWIKGKRVITYSEKEVDCIITWMSNGGMQRFEVDPSTICQCTGLKDKNGKLIWENDIVGYYDKYVGKWRYGLVGYGEFNCSCCGGVYGWHFGDEDIREYQFYEVKGNKFDNPELLEA